MPFEAVLGRQLHQHFGKDSVILNDEHVLFLHMKIGSRYLHWQLSQRSRSDNGLRAVRRVERFARFHIHLTAVAHRQIEREGGTLPLARTVKPNLALKQDRKSTRMNSSH